MTTHSCDEIAAEVFEERSAIAEHDGLLTREQAEAQGKLESDDYRASCEARDRINDCFDNPVDGLPDVARLEAYLALVLLKRGKKSADQLRADCRIAWKNELKRRKAK